MSVILQTFLHNPHLQRFFLSDGHNREICPHSTEVADDAASPPPKPCLCCELDRLFCDVSASPFSASAHLSHTSLGA